MYPFDLPPEGCRHCRRTFCIGLSSRRYNCPQLLPDASALYRFSRCIFTLLTSFCAVPLSSHEAWARNIRCVFKRHAMKIAVTRESAIKEDVLLRVKQRCGGCGAFVYLLVLNIFSDLVDYFLESRIGFHDVAHHIALSYEALPPPNEKSGLSVHTTTVSTCIPV